MLWWSIRGLGVNLGKLLLRGFIYLLAFIFTAAWAGASIAAADTEFAKQYHSYQQYSRSGKSFLDKGDFNSAIKSLSKAIELSPFEKNLYQQRGIARYRAKMFTEAIGDFDRVMVMDSRSHQAFLYRGLCREALKDFVEALKDYTSALNLNPNDPAVHNNLAWLYATAKDDQVKDPARALEHARKAEELTNGENAQVLDTLAWALFENGVVDKAIETQEKALEMEPENNRFQANLKYYQGKADGYVVMKP